MDTVEFDFGQPKASGWGEQLWKWANRALWALFVLSNVSMCSRIGKLADNQAPAFVQSADGYGIPIAKHHGSYRSDIVVSRFVQDWLTISFNWDAQLNEQGQPVEDKGQPVAGKNVPTDTWLGSFALSEDFRPQWLNTIAEKHDLMPYLTGQKSRILRIRKVDIDTPEPGTYQATVIATWMDFTGNDKTGKGSRFNKVITLTAIEQANPRPAQVNVGPHEQAIYALLSRGLLITDIEDYKP